jgi:hypothetical protein
MDCDASNCQARNVGIAHDALRVRAEATRRIRVAAHVLVVTLLRR